MLDMLLDDSRTYQDATKEVFLKKLADVFQVFKDSGDTNLIALSGKCAGCEQNKGKTGYTFLGNVSSSRLDLIFEETDNE